MLATRKVALVCGVNTAITERKHVARKPAWNARLTIYISLLLIGLMMGVVALQNHLLVQSEYELWAQKKEWLSAVKHSEQTKLEIAQLKSPGRIQQLAAAKIGMIVPTTVYQVGVKADGVSDGKVADATKIIAKTN
ncbi:MAG: hypothetical protein WCV63_03815 [Negativicutes bacterium]